MYRVAVMMPDTAAIRTGPSFGWILACLFMVMPVLATTGEAPAEPRGEAAAVEHYLDSVHELEAHDGAWAPALQQELFGLGVAYQKEGRHADATSVLARAEHLTRINEGLYSTADVPVLERLIESHAALGEWDKVSNRYRQMFRIYQHNYGDHDRRLLPVLNRLSAWHLRAYLDAVGGNPVEHLLNARAFYDSAISIIETESGTQDARIASMLRQRALVDYYVAGHAPVVRESFGFRDESADEMALQAHIAKSFAAGRAALRRAALVRHADASEDELSCTEALAELADWHQLFSRRQHAIQLYQEAWTHGNQASDGSDAQRIHAAVFGKPLALPLIPEELDSMTPQPSNPAWIRVRFDVSDSGRASAMEVLESSPPASDRDIARLRKRLLSTPFRPRFENGQPVTTQGVDYRYTYTP